MDVYKASAFEDRVNYAASVISKGISVCNARTFDTCFEMGDSEYVAAALVRRTIKNPNSKLAANIFRFIGRDFSMQNYEETKHLSRKELHRAAVTQCVERCQKHGHSNL